MDPAAADEPQVKRAVASSRWSFMAMARAQQLFVASDRQRLLWF
jgi:hypothetical protein